MVELKVRVNFIEELLGTCSNDPAIHSEFIASKAPDAPSREEEVAAVGVDEVIEKSITVFPRESEKPFLYDYQIKGFFKDACGVLSRIAEKGEDGKRKACNESSKLTAYKKVIDGLVFVSPRKIFLELPADRAIGNCQRPLRGQTAKGERIALANSETAPEGTGIVFTVKCLDDKLAKAVKEWLDYGVLRGIGQWRNSGKGRFEWKEIE
jgi:hypothetical protein